ncbi:MAG TPA: Bax inhibitor-1 family protein [Candidatus Dormibacteraeota bacterium]|nr:Bax inhibitor-1 family protein [Candidatus Dormibacteraeota bacterium]
MMYDTARAAAVRTRSLLGQVLVITAGALAIAGITAYAVPAPPPLVYFGSLIGAFALIFAVSATRANPSLSLGLFYLFAVADGVWLGPIIARYTAIIGQAQVAEAALTAGVGMGLLGALVYTSTFDFRRLSGLAFGALIALVAIGIASAFFHFVQPTTYAWLVLIIFAVVTLVDFGRVRAAAPYDTAVTLALSIFLDFVNIFVALLQLFANSSGSRRND